LQSYLLILLATGAGAGFASGLLGIGGGFIMVPITYWVVATIGISETLAIRIAFGTSLLVILPTAISGAWRHNKKEAVQWKAALALGLCGLVGALAGATLATYLSGELLEAGFGGLVLAVALWMGLGMTPKYPSSNLSHRERNKVRKLAACGFPIGMVSGLTGLGGGVLIVPALVLVAKFPMHTAIGTSIASVIFTSLGGVIGYAVNGFGVPGLLPHSIGYINLPIWLCLAATSIPLAQVGAKTAHALPTKQLRYIFIAFILYVGLKMLGVF